MNTFCKCFFAESVPFRSSSTLPVPHPSSHPPTPTRLIGTGPNFEFGEERGDLIQFYNQVWDIVIVYIMATAE